MRDGEPNMYAALATMRNGYLQMQWSRVQILIVFNTVALPVMFASNQSSDAKFAICAVAVGVHALIMLAVFRADMWISFIDSRLSALERVDWDSDAAVRVRVFSHRDFTARRVTLFASRYFFGLLGVMISVLWLQQLRHYW